MPQIKKSPRRTRALGSCKTCRRRHVKCDRRRPSCLTCQAMGISCEGFSAEVRWIPSRMQEVSDGGDEAVEKQISVGDGVRRHLYTGEI